MEALFFLEKKSIQVGHPSNLLMFFFGVRQVVSQNQTLNIQPEPDSQKLKSETNKLAASGLEKRHRLKIKRQVQGV